MCDREKCCTSKHRVSGCVSGWMAKLSYSALGIQTRNALLPFVLQGLQLDLHFLSQTTQYSVGEPSCCTIIQLFPGRPSWFPPLRKTSVDYQDQQLLAWAPSAHRSFPFVHLPVQKSADHERKSLCPSLFTWPPCTLSQWWQQSVRAAAEHPEAGGVRVRGGSPQPPATCRGGINTLL